MITLSTQIDRLILHIKHNILHYMQAIWATEMPDQRYFRLYNMEIQWPGPVLGKLGQIPSAKDVVAGVRRAARLPDVMEQTLEEDGVIQLETPAFAETRRLHEVADLSAPLGFRGNLAVFRLLENNSLCTYLAQDFLDSHFGIFDPDPLAAIPTPSDAVDIARCVWGRDDLSDEDLATVAEWLMGALQVSHLTSQEVVVPTGEVFIEALVGSEPLLEDFKLLHRAYDVQKARADAITAEIEALRRALRLEGGDTADPDVDRYVKVDGLVNPTLPVGPG